MPFVYIHSYFMSKKMETNVQSLKSPNSSLFVWHFYPLLFSRFWDRKKIAKNANGNILTYIIECNQNHCSKSEKKSGNSGG